MSLINKKSHQSLQPVRKPFSPHVLNYREGTTTFSIMTLSITTLGITIFCLTIRKCDTQNNYIQCLCRMSQLSPYCCLSLNCLTLYWVLLCWVSLCWMSWGLINRFWHKFTYLFCKLELFIAMKQILWYVFVSLLWIYR